MSIAGFDATAGAGILADIKTFEQLKVYGLGVISANTFQTDCEVRRVQWISIEDIIEQIDMLMSKFSVNYFKFGILNDSNSFDVIRDFILKKNSKAKIIWDPVLHSSSGFSFFNQGNESISSILKGIYLITPNEHEFQALFKSEQYALELSYQTYIYLKGGHRLNNVGEDVLYAKGNCYTLLPNQSGIVYPKHGSGCIMAAAITAYLALGFTVDIACDKAKRYIEGVLTSNSSLLGWHSI